MKQWLLLDLEVGEGVLLSRLKEKVGMASMLAFEFAEAKIEVFPGSIKGVVDDGFSDGVVVMGESSGIVEGLTCRSVIFRQLFSVHCV